MYDQIRRILEEVDGVEYLPLFEKEKWSDVTLPLLTAEHLNRMNIPMGIAALILSRTSTTPAKETPMPVVNEALAESLKTGDTLVIDLNNGNVTSAEVLPSTSGVDIPTSSIAANEHPKIITPTTTPQKRASATPRGSRSGKWSGNKRSPLRKSPRNVQSTSTCTNSAVPRQLFPPKKHLLITSAETLKEQLSQSDTGLGLLSLYKKTDKPFDRANALKLAEIIIRTEFQGDPERTLGKDSFSNLTNCIVQLFPREKKETYFIPAVRQNKKKVSAKGKLWEKYKSRKKFLRCALPSQQRNREGTENMDVVLEEPQPIDEDEVNEAITWLSDNDKPEHLVLKRWNSTVKTRHKTGSKWLDKIEDYYMKFKALGDAKLGIKLLQSDFKYLHGKDEDNFFINWSSVAQKVLQYCSDKYEKDQNFSRSIDQQGIDLTVAGSAIQNTALLLLPFLFPLPGNVNRGRQGSIAWKPSREEVCSGFVKWLRSSAEINEFLNGRKKFRVGKKLPNLPITIFIGTPEDVDVAYVSINDTLYSFQSLTTAFDFCFKSYFCLQSFYPPEASQCYIFIQKYVYKITTSFDNVRVNDVANSLGL